MAASISITLQCRVTTQKGDKVAVTGDHKVLGEWDPMKLKFMKPKKSIHDSNVWILKIDVPITCQQLEYRYVVCRKFETAHEDDGEETFIIRHWEAGIHARKKQVLDLGSNPVIDIYGVFESDQKMFIDQGWLLGESEIQLRFYKDPIHMFKKRDRSPQYNVKCSTLNLLHYDFPSENGTCRGSSVDEHFDQIVHASNPHIRVTCLGKYNNKEQYAHGMVVSNTDYVIYKLRTYEPECHGIKVDFYTSMTEDTREPIHLGYANLLPLHLSEGTGSVTLAINNVHGFPVGQVTVRYLVCKPPKVQLCDMSKSYTKWWNRKRVGLEVGHRGLGDTHHSDINTSRDEAKDIKHENTISSLISAGDSGADFVEFDVQLSRDRVPIIWHDFKVSILLRKKKKGQHRVHHIPVHELTLSQLKDLRVEFAKTIAAGHDEEVCESPDVVEITEDLSLQLNPFPMLREALDAVDETVGFYVELKYPQILYDSKGREEGLDSYFERNEFLDPILKELFDHAKGRRIVLASFDPDVCILARLKQNRYPVIYLIEDKGNEPPYLHDIRTHKITSAIQVATSEKFLGLSVNASALLRREEALLEKILDEHLICFVWGRNANDPEVRRELKEKGAHAICHDEIAKKGTPSTFRAEHEEKLRKVVAGLDPSPGMSPNTSQPSSRASSILGSATDLSQLLADIDIQSKLNGSYSVANAGLGSIVIAPQSELSNGNDAEISAISSNKKVAAALVIPKVEISNGSLSGEDDSLSESSLDKGVSVKLTDQCKMKPSATSSPPQKSNSGKTHDYTTEFY